MGRGISRTVFPREPLHLKDAIGRRAWRWGGGLLAWALLFAHGNGVRAEDDLARLARQTTEFEWGPLNPGQTGMAQARQWAAKLRRDGSWADIDYSDQTRGAWKTETHLKRTEAMAANAARARAEGHRDPLLDGAARAAARYWIRHDYQNPNWWYNEIAVPGDMASILLMTKHGLSGKDRAAGMKIAARATISMTGQNRVWMAGIVFRRALAGRNLALAGAARDAILGELKVADGEGLQGDDSFQQHGPEQQMGNYGLSFARDMAAWAWIWRGTALAMPGGKMALLRRYIVHGLAMVTVNGAMDISACGRQLFPGAQAAKGRDVLAVLGAMANADPGHAEQYLAAARRDSRPVAAGGASLGEAVNKDFYRSDYMVHRRAGFYASVKLCSNRVIGGELINGENLKGRYLADGAAFLYQSGTEYADIFPVWDWRRVPGVTCMTTGTTLAPAGKMATDYAGGVSDGSYGAAGLDYNRDGVTGAKGWFFLDEGVVCLGAGLSGTGGMLRTSVDQRLADGGAVSSGGALSRGVNLCKGVSWILEGREGYLFFPQRRDVWAGVQRQSGSWRDVFSAGSGAEVARDVFSLWIEHGPGAGSYAYMLVPGATAAELQRDVAAPPVEILSNTPEVQAVRDKGAGVTEILFHKAGRLEAGGLAIAADEPCAVMLRGGAMRVADPAQKEREVTLTIDGKALPVRLPGGGFSGGSATAAGVGSGLLSNPGVSLWDSSDQSMR